MYVDGYLLALPRDQLAAYRRFAEQAGAVWRSHGALAYHECVGDDLEVAGMGSFVQQMALAPDEILVLSWVLFDSREARDRINARALADPRLAGGCPLQATPARVRMVYGGFRSLVDL